MSYDGVAILKDFATSLPIRSRTLGDLDISKNRLRHLDRSAELQKGELGPEARSEGGMRPFSPHLTPPLRRKGEDGLTLQEGLFVEHYVACNCNGTRPRVEQATRATRSSASKRTVS